MKILIAPDKFKGSMDARAAAEAIARGFHIAGVAAEFVLQPIADGGEGTGAIIAESIGARRIMHQVTGPLGFPVEAAFYLKDEVAYLDASDAAGLWRLAPHEYNPLRTTTFGVGEQILAAQAAGARRLIIGLGGSSTCDGGMGMAAALGFRFLAGAEEIRTPAELAKLTRIISSERTFPEIIAACDVTNPLLGPQGTAHVFAPQKGASDADVETLESALSRLAAVVKRDLGVDHCAVPGAGAAGGLGFGLMSFCRATMRSGFEVVAAAIGLEMAVRECDLVITGEGSLDAQTLSGKGPAGVAALARRHGKRVIAFAGLVTTELRESTIFDAAFEINTGALPIEESISRGPELLAAAVAQFCASSHFAAWSCSQP